MLANRLKRQRTRLITGQKFSLKEKDKRGKNKKK